MKNMLLFRCDCSETIHSIPSTETALYVRVRCPRCNKLRYQCRMCIKSSVAKFNMQRHINNRHHTTDSNSSVAFDFDPGMPESFNNRGDGNVSFANEDDKSSSSSSTEEEEETSEGEKDEFLVGLVDLSSREEESTVVVDNEFQFDYEAMTDYDRNICLRNQFPFEDNNISRGYFWQDYMHLKRSGEKLGGIRGLTWRSISQTYSYKEQDMLNVEDAKLMFLFADHALNNTGKQQKVFFEIIDELVQRLKGKRDSFDTFVQCLNDEQRMALDSIISSMNETQTRELNEVKLNSKLDIKAPTTTAEANSMLLKGKFSVFSNIPNAAVRILADHAVVSLDSLFDHIMAQGIPIQWKQDRNGVVDNTTINGSLAATKLYEEFKIELDDSNNTALCFIIGWSDGFLRVYVKQKKNSAWILTIAIPNPDGNPTSIFHTYCVAVGNSSSDHTPVIEYFLRELETVKQQKIRYCGISGDFIKTSFRLAAYSSDRIERGDLLKTMIGGTYGLRSHFACGIDPNAFPFCDRCFDTLISSLENSKYPTYSPGNESCQVCCRWDSNCTSPASMTIPLPSKYPRKASSTSPPAPTHRTVNETHLVPVRQEFSWLKQGLEYAHHNLITNERDASGGRVRWTKDEAVAYLRTMGVNENVYNDVWRSARAKRDNPLGATVQYIPALWNTNILMERFLNSPMHLLFHGLVSAVMDLIHKFMTLLSKLATFERLANKYLTKIESLRMDWLKLRELPKTKWLAENLLGVTRILPAVYGMFFTNFAVPPIYSKAAERLKQTINALHVLISSLMSPQCSFADSKRIDMYIKIFLSGVHRSAKLILGANEGDAWLTNKANPVSLLNLTRQLEQFGPVRWYYEGICERYIQVFKPYLTKNMRRTSTYFQQKLILLHKMVFMKWLSRSFGNNEEEDTTKYQSKLYNRYQSLDMVMQDFDNGFPISCFKLDKGPQQLVWVAFGKPQGGRMIPAIVSGSSAESCCGFYYYHFSLLEDKCAKWIKTDLQKHISCHGIMFPFVRPGNEPFDHKFTLIFCDWDVMQSNKTKGESLIDRQLYCNPITHDNALGNV